MVLSHQRQPSRQISLKNLFLWTAAIAMIFGLSIRVGVVATFLAACLPLIGVTLVSLGGQLRPDSSASEACTAMGSFVIAVWVIAFMIPSWTYILLAIFSMI